MLKPRKSLLLIPIILILLSSNAAAGEQRAFSFTHNTRYIKKSDLKDGTGEFGFSRSKISLHSTYSLFQKIPVALGAGIQQFNINDDSNVNLPDTLQSKNIKLGVHLPVPFYQKKNLFLGVDVLPSWNSASDHSFAEESFRTDYSVSMIWIKNDKFITACGIWLRPGYQNAFIPFLGFRYKPNERIIFNFLSSEPNIEYSITDQTKVLLEFAFLSHEFDVTSGDKKGDTVSMKDMEAGLGLKHYFSEFLSAKVSIGWVFNQKYEYLDAEQGVSPENSLYAAYNFKLRF